MKKNLLILMLSLFLTGYVYAHGYIDNPPSRSFLCTHAGGALNKACGAVMYEPQSIEGVKGFPVGGPSDGLIASAGNPSFSELNEQTPGRWYKVNLKSGAHTFDWTLTARHSTTSWKYYITKQAWDPNNPLARADFDLKPFCERFDNGKIPQSKVQMNCTIPQRSGYQVILGVWTIADTGNAFYQVIDANMTK